MSKTRTNTTAKGDAFEDRVFNILQKLLQAEVLPLNCKRSRIYQKKKYKSIESQDGIVFDIAIETYMPDSDEIAELTLIECKDYNSPIEVSKVRDFIYRINEVKANKGYFFTTSYYQKGAIDLAKTNHLGLVTVNASDEPHWTTRRIAIREKEEINSDIIKLLSGGLPERNYAFAAIGKGFYTNFYDFIHDDIGLRIHQALTIDYLTKDQIISIIYERLKLSQTTHQIISDEDLLGYISNEGYTIKTSKLPNKTLGEIDFEDKNILISDALEERSPRWRFTIAHELGHLILHSKQIKISNIKAIEDYFDDEMVENINISDKTIARMEFQANMFASLLLIPPHYFDLVYRGIFVRDGIRNYPKLTIDDQPCNIIGNIKLVAEMAAMFNVSKAAIKRRLLDLGYLEEKYESYEIW